MIFCIWPAASVAQDATLTELGTAQKTDLPMRIRVLASGRSRSFLVLVRLIP